MLHCALISEFYKLKRTPILWLHIVMPLIGALTFLLYYHGKSNYLMQFSGYMEMLCIVFPLLIGIVCGLLCFKEEQTGNFQFMLSEVHSRAAAYLSKLILLLVLALVAVIIAVGVFAFGLHGVSAALIIKMALAAFLGNIFLYMFHLFVGFRFGRGASIGLGVFGTLLTALMMTGLGDKIWQFVPWAWGLRSCECLILSVRNPEYAAFAASQIQGGMIFGVLMTAAALSLSLLWFSRWEGSRSNE